MPNPAAMRMVSQWFPTQSSGDRVSPPMLAHGAAGARATNLSMYTLHAEMFSWEEKSEILLNSQRGVRPLERLQSTGTWSSISEVNENEMFKMSSFSGFNISCDILYLSTEGPVELGALVVHDAGDLWGLGGRVPPVRTIAKGNCGATCCKMMNFRAVHPAEGPSQRVPASSPFRKQPRAQWHPIVLSSLAVPCSPAPISGAPRMCLGLCYCWDPR